MSPASGGEKEPTWEEYLADAARYLSAVRATSESGLTPPAPPLRPLRPCPAELRDEAHLLHLGFDQLAVEVTDRLSALEAHLVTTPRSPYQSRPRARYLDAPL